MPNWKTTLFGALSAIFLFLSDAVPELKGIFVALSSLSLALMAYFTKDKNVTGPS